MKLELGQLGSGGVVYDTKPYDLPPNIFNKSMNVEFDGFSAKPMIEEVGLLTPLLETFEAIALHQGYVYGNLAVWVDSYGTQLSFRNVSFGGENSGFPIVYQFANSVSGGVGNNTQSSAGQDVGALLVLNYG